MDGIAFVTFAEQHTIQHLSCEKCLPSLHWNWTLALQHIRFITDETSDSFMATIPNINSLTLLIHIVSGFPSFLTVSTLLLPLCCWVFGRSCFRFFHTEVYFDASLLLQVSTTVKLLSLVRWLGRRNLRTQRTSSPRKFLPCTCSSGYVYWRSYMLPDIELYFLYLSITRSIVYPCKRYTTSTPVLFAVRKSCLLSVTSMVSMGDLSCTLIPKTQIQKTSEVAHQSPL